MTSDPSQKRRYREGRFRRQLHKLRTDPEVRWYRTDDAEFPYEADLRGEERNARMRIRVNEVVDYPSAFSLFIGDVIALELDEWPENWIRSDRSKRRRAKRVRAPRAVAKKRA